MSIIASIVVSLIVAAVSLVLSELLRPKPKIEDARPRSLGDFQFPTATEGRVVPVIFGRVRLKGPNVVWYGDFQQRPVKTTVKTGMWSKKKVVTGYRYYVGFQMGLCRGPISVLRRIWVGEKEIFDGTQVEGDELIDTAKLEGGDDFGDGGLQGNFQLYLGDEVQAIDPYLEAQQGAGLTPAYRGSCYVIWLGPSETSRLNGLGINGWVGNTTSIKPWAFEVERYPNALGLGGGMHIVNGADANPACVMYELLTDTDWGFGFSASDIDIAGFQAHGATLYDEGQGFSFVMDNKLDSGDFLKELERQVDGVVYFDALSGKFKLNLSRGGYDIDTIPQVDSTNIIEVREYTRGTWDETVNQVRIGFADRARDYFETYAPAEDIANLRIQNGEQVQSEITFPGVKDKTLAAKLASRELRSLSQPLAKATVVVDRSLHSLSPIEPIAYTDETLGINKLAMRVMGIDLGDLDNGRIQLSLVQDVFGDFTPFSAPPEDTGWTPPVQAVSPIPLVDSITFEAPRGFCLERDADGYPGTIDRIWVGGRRQTGQEIAIQVFGTTGATYTPAAELYDFLLIGTLGQDLSHARLQPNSGLVRIDPGPDSYGVLLDALSTTISSLSDIGLNLVNLIMIDDEFLAFSSASDGGSYVNLSGLWGGLLDSIIDDHAMGTPVYLLFAGGGLTDSTFPPNDSVDLKLRPESRDDIVAEGSAPVEEVDMDDRARRPYPAGEQWLNGLRMPPGPLDVDDQRPATSGLDNRGVDVWFVRRDFRETDEVRSHGSVLAGNPPIVTDAEDVDPTFPAANNTQYRMEVIKDPGGTPTSLFTTDWNSGEGNIFISRTLILANNGGNLPATLRIEIEVRHDFAAQTFTSRYKAFHDFAIFSTSISSPNPDTNLGVIADSVISAIYVTPVAGTLNFDLGTALASGDVEARVNGGSFSVIIPATNTGGSIAGLSAFDTVEVRHTQSGAAGLYTFLRLDMTGTGSDAYAILSY